MGGYLIICALGDWFVYSFLRGDDGFGDILGQYGGVHHVARLSVSSTILLIATNYITAIKILRTNNCTIGFYGGSVGSIVVILGGASRDVSVID